MDLILNPSENRCLHKSETCSMFQGGYGSHIFSFHIVIGPKKKKSQKKQMDQMHAGDYDGGIVQH